MPDGGAVNEREQARRILIAGLSDFRQFCGLLDILRKDGQRGKLRLNAIQSAYCLQLTGRDVVLKARQVGFTTLEQARDVYRFITEPGARIVTTCQSLSDHTPQKLLSANYRLMFESLDRIFAAAGVPLTFRTRSATEWILNGRDSTLRIIEAGASEASAQKKGRAGTISRLHLTETAFYEYAEETLNAMFECVPHGGSSEIVSESTPNGATGVFYNQCRGAQSGESGYRLHFFPWFQQTLDGAFEYAVPLSTGEEIVPRTEREEWLVSQGVTPEQLKWYRQKVAEKGQDKVDQEYPSDPETCFLVSGRGFFDQSTTTRLLAQARDPIERRERDRVSIFQRPIKATAEFPDRDYILAVDTAEGGGGDPSGALMYDRDTGEHVATINGQYTPHQLAESAAKLGREYNDALLAVERNNHGHAVHEALESTEKYWNVFQFDDEKPGWPTNAVTRPVMLDGLENAHRCGLWKSPDRNVLQQMRVFVIKENGKAEAARGEKDDLVMAAAIGWSVRQRPPMHRPPRELPDDILRNFY